MIQDDTLFHMWSVCNLYHPVADPPLLPTLFLCYQNLIEALIEDINIDIEVAYRSLERPDYAAFKEDPLFLQL